MLIVSHMDAVNASVTRYKPWALVYPVQHTGFTASYREKYDGARAVPAFIPSEAACQAVSVP